MNRTSEAICTGIEVYMAKDDAATCELIFSISDADECHSDRRVIDLFHYVSEFGGEDSKNAALKAQARFIAELAKKLILILNY